MNRIHRERLEQEIEEHEHVRELNKQFHAQPRQCIDCLLKTTRVICPRCGGECDIDVDSDYYELERIEL